MEQLRVMVVYGTRPEAIKVAPLVMQLRTATDVRVDVVVTGQHREMLDQVNRLFGITPDADLDLMSDGQSLSDLAGKALIGLGRVIADRKPHCVVVQGDTATAFIAGLAAFYSEIPVVHLEAGLRTGDLTSPFPEEGNRQLLSRIARLHMAPTQDARRNLLAEGIPSDRIVTTGNTVIDALLECVARPAPAKAAELTIRGARTVLVTTHRRESWGAPMSEAMRAIRDVANKYEDVSWLVPMHRNPLVREIVERELADVSRVTLTEPLDYETFCHVLNAAHLVITDSGGVQEEAPSLGTPVLVMRDTTERPEAVQAGAARLVGTGRDSIVKHLESLLDDDSEYSRMARSVNPFGDGMAAKRVAAAIMSLFGRGRRMLDFNPGGVE